MSGSQEWCGGCGGEVAPDCVGSLSRAGVLKAHWECWSDCNLHCDFCFRTRTSPLGTPEALTLLDALWTGGVRIISFAGGDPTLRPDLPLLLEGARSRGFRVEVQTNAHRIPPALWAPLTRVDRVCLSLDGPDAALHDAMRSTRGNFTRVVRAAERLDGAGVPFVVRTVVSRRNAARLPELGPVLSRFHALENWTILEFAPANDGHATRARHELSTEEFVDVVGRCRAAAPGVEVRSTTNAQKNNVYLQVTSSGEVYPVDYGRLDLTGAHTMVGNVLSRHLVDLARDLGLDPQGHADRYAEELRCSCE